MKAPPSLPLFVEIGCEEIPARFLSEGQKAFQDALDSALREARLLPAGGAGQGVKLQSYSTPRRLVAWVPEVLVMQMEQVEEVLGPSVKVALDAQGKPTIAAHSFAEKHGARIESLVRVSTPRGEYMALRKTTRGRAARELLPALLAAVITAISFPKSMYWVAKSGPRFVRPIRWMLALLGDGGKARVVPVEIAGVRAADVTYGHRALSKGPVRVTGFGDYTRKLRKAFVEFDPENRRQMIRTELEVLLEEWLRIVEDQGLEDWLVNSTEWPSAIRGGFHERFLELPREILVTVMRDHQKYFALEDREGRLQPFFIAVLNMDSDSRGLIRLGHERVLAARFTDAQFFWTADQKVPLKDRVGLLENVVYRTELGSYAEKVRRMKMVASSLCSFLREAQRLTQSETEHALRAVELSKCDLTTQMVQEFPELQGVVGGLYARAQGEPQEVSEAIYDHYLPQGLEDHCPRALIGAVVSLADKIDGVVAGFATGQEPTGSSDPFALRRQASGIIKVLLELQLPLSSKEMVMHAVNALNIMMQRPHSDIFAAVRDFLEERLRYYFETVRKLRYDSVRAVLGAGWDVPVDALRRAEALERVRGGENFEPLSVAAKRIKNILAKSATSEDWQPGEVDATVLEGGAERELYDAYVAVAEEAGTLGSSGDYQRALGAVASLRPAVDRFFDKVLVMAPDPALRQNRLRLLAKLDGLFSSIAHFAEMVPGPANVDASTSKSNSQ